MKLEVGKTYLTRPNPDGSMGRAFKMNFMREIMFGMWKLFREVDSSDTYWMETGEHSSGDDALKLIMEVPVAAPAPTPAPVAAPADAGDDIQLFEVNWTKRTVSPK